MSIDRINHAFDGVLVFLCVLLGVDSSPLFVSHGFAWFAVYGGFMMFQSTFTGICPAIWILKALGLGNEADRAGSTGGRPATVERVNHAVDGLLVLVTLLLGIPTSPIFVSQGFAWFAGFVGFMMFQSSFTRLCPALWILKSFGLRTEAELGR